jgi:hypothetical protein
MPINTIAGKWEGHYKYGTAYSLKKQAEPVPFTLEITINEDGIIKGICTDDIIKKLSLAPATIEGIFENDTILFIKTYPCLIIIDEHDNTVAIHDKPSAGIQYKGNLIRRLFSKKYFLKGIWDISGSFIDESGNARYYTFEGKWKLEKI